MNTDLKIKIFPSLLASDFSRLRDEVRGAEEGGAEALHVDVMDGHFVPNLTIGPFIVEAIKRVATVPLNVHLMIEEPERFIGPFADAGSDSILYHVEVDPKGEVIEQIRGRGLGVGVTFNPETSEETLAGVLDRVDMVLAMTVSPGFGGQAFKAEVLEKIRNLRAKMGWKGDIIVDGGIKEGTVGEAASAGANVFVAGTSVFRANNLSIADAENRALPRIRA